MYKRIYNKLFFIGLTVLLINLTGCSSGSLTPRYGDKYSKKRTTAYTNDSTNVFGQNDTMMVLDEFPDSLLDYFEYDDEEPYVSVRLSKDSIISFLNKTSNTTNITERDKIIFEVIKFLDTPYRYGGTSPNGIDCSAFTGAVFKNSLHIDLPRSSADQYTVGHKIGNQEDLKFGDLVFFKTRRRRSISHVGIYLGNRLFAHASSSQGVIVSSLDETYYKKRYVGAKRVSEKISAK